MSLARPITSYTEKEAETQRGREEFEAQQLNLNFAFYLSPCSLPPGKDGQKREVWGFRDAQETSLGPMGSRVRGAFFPGHQSLLPPLSQPSRSWWTSGTGSGTSQNDPLNQASQQAGGNTRCALRAGTQCPARLCRWRHVEGAPLQGAGGLYLHRGGLCQASRCWAPAPQGSGWETPRCRDAWPPLPLLYSVALNGTLAFPKPLPPVSLPL